MVEQGNHNPCVAGSNPAGATKFKPLIIRASFPIRPAYHSVIDYGPNASADDPPFHWDMTECSAVASRWGHGIGLRNDTPGENSLHDFSQVLFRWLLHFMPNGGVGLPSSEQIEFGDGSNE